MTILLANYTSERAAIESLLVSECDPRVAIVKGTKNIGKSDLLRWLKTAAGSRCLVALVEFKGFYEPLSPLSVVDTLVTAVGREHFPSYNSASQKENERVKATITGCNLVGNNNVLIASGGETPEDKERIALQLADHVFDDLAKLSKNVVIAFDSLEVCGERLQNWICYRIFPRLIALDHLRVILSGQNVAEDGWCSEVKLVQLKGVPSVQDWLDYIHAIRRQLPAEASENPKVYLSGVLAVAKGVPGDIATLIKSWPAAL